jgi:phage baseplate assembly protein W
MQIQYPLDIDGRGRVADSTYDLHIRQMIEQVLFTRSGERVNRPEFGSGLSQLIFAPNSSELAAATQFIVQGALERWLGDLILVEAVEVEEIESKFQIIIRYVVRQTQQLQETRFVSQNGIISREV